MRRHSVLAECRFVALGPKSARSVPPPAAIFERMASDKTTELRFRCASVTHALMPPHEPDGYTTTSDAFSIGVSFTGHRKALIESPNGRVSQLTFGPGSFGITGADAATWLRVAEPGEAVEIYASTDLLTRVEREMNAKLRAMSGLDMRGMDAIVWSTCARFRMVAHSLISMSELEAEERVQDLLMHVLVRHLGARLPKLPRGKLSARRLGRVVDLVESRLRTPPDLAEMARAASMSAFHFQRMFRATTGSSPHEYVTARRMDAARRLLEVNGTTVASVASALGFRHPAHFRRVFRAQFGTSPRGLR
jgi:AraC family transcriptional regulator